MRRNTYSDPYLSGVGLGLTLLSSYVLAGRGLGASGAFSSVVAAGTSVVLGAERSGHLPAVAPYLGAGLLHDWLLLEVAGVLVGGFLSAWLAGRLNIAIHRGEGITDGQRMGVAIAGGILMGLGAKFARGCTSGQALTGGALLSAGSWVFVGTCFAAGYLLAPFVKKAWL